MLQSRHANEMFWSGKSPGVARRKSCVVQLLLMHCGSGAHCRTAEASLDDGARLEDADC